MATIAELEKKVERLENELAAIRSHVSDTSVYTLSDWERTEVKKGLSDIYASDEEVTSVLAKYGLQNTI